MVGDNYRKRLNELINKIEMISHLDQMIEDENEKDFAAQLFLELETGEMSLDELVEFRRPFAKKRLDERSARFAELSRKAEAGTHQLLWWVSNKSGSSVGVMAVDRSHAAELVYRFGFVRDEKNALVRKASDSDVDRITKDGSAFGRAVRAGTPGVIEQKGRNVVVGDQVFTPITVVK